MLGRRLARGHACQRMRLNYNSQRAVPEEEEGGFSCRKSVLALGPTTASRAGAALLQPDPGLWGPDRGRHGNGGERRTGDRQREGSCTVPGFRFGADKLPPAADVIRAGREFSGLGSGMGIRGSMLRCGVCLWFSSKGFGRERVSTGGTAPVGDIWGRF